MPLITLQSKFSFNNSIKDQNLLLFLQSSYEMISTGMPYRILSTSRSQEWNDFRFGYPEQYKQVNKEVTEYSKHYLKSYKHRLFDLSGRYEIPLVDFEAEIATTDINNINSTVLSIFYYSKSYQLKEMSGQFLILSDQEGNDLEKDKCFMVALSDTLTINTYKK